MNREEIVRVKNLVVRYGRDLILKDISFSVQEKEIFIIVGGSGSGKTTLMRHMVGLEAPAAGQIFIGETDISAVSEDRFFNTLKHIGVLFQSSALIGSMTVAENVALPIAEFSNLSTGAVAAMVEIKLSLVGLEGYADHLPSEISGGMKKRAGLARALALNPDILFLDEPSAGLDPVIASEIDSLILHINQTLGTTIIIVTHDLDSIFTLGQRAIMLDKSSKNIIAQGTPADMRDNNPNPVVRRFFSRKPADSLVKS
ncbi:MAG: ATP-binding cassette domain-containing protein [Desulfobacteraceae bacterium]|nr:ATP-binding cassette domain-containing protein [Desulfobacteraceae bacterium]